MEKKEISDILSGVTPTLKKELLNNLVASLLKELNEPEKKEMLKAILTGGTGTGQVVDMVER
jgi:hypothetical protein